jgi:hypothetical protein
MKKVIFSLAVATALLSSCKKENQPCNCGVIISDDASDYLKIQVTGDASKTLRWVAVVRGTEIEIS